MNWWERFKAWLDEPVMKAVQAAQEQKFTLSSDMDWTYINTLVHGPGTPPWGDGSNGDGNSAVFACLMALAMAYPEPPLRVYTRRGSPNRATRKTHLPNHPLQAILDKPTPNGEFSMKDLWFWTAWCKHTDGNAYWLKVRSGNAETGNVIQLWPVSPHLIRPVTLKNSDDFISHYKMQVAPNDFENVPVENVIHFRYGRDDGDTRYGLSPLKRLVRQVATDEEADKFVEALLKNYAVPGLVVTPSAPTLLTADDAKRIGEAMAQKYGNGNRGNIAVLSKDARVEQFGFSPKDLDMSILHRIPEERISAVLGVPAIVAGLGAGLDRATYANFREAREMFTEQKLVPMWGMDADVLNVSLRPDFTSDRGIFIEFDLSDIRALQEDEDAKYNRLNIGVQGKWILRNEARAEIGLDPIDGWDEVDTKPPAPPPPQLIQPQQEDEDTAANGEGEKRLPFYSNGYRHKQVKPPQTGNTRMDTELRHYHEEITTLTGRALEGDISESQFRQRMVELTAAAILAMFLLAGGDPNSESGRAQLDEQQRIARESARGLADDIYSGRYDGEDAAEAAERQRVLENRLVLWDFSLAGVYAIGQIHQPDRVAPVVTAGGDTVIEMVEPSLTWILGNTEKHCRDCLDLNGQTKTTAEWQAAGIRPQSPDLECGGWQCDCSLVEEEKIGLRQAEQMIRVAQNEAALIFDADGRLISSQAGTEETVKFTAEQLEAMRGGVVTHNHPMGGTFSRNDIGMALHNEVSEIRAVDDVYRYSFKIPEGNTLRWADIEDVHQGALESNAAALRPSVRNGSISIEAAAAQVEHNAWKAVAAEFDFEYSRSSWR